jgi:hypothetical protein
MEMQLDTDAPPSSQQIGVKSSIEMTFAACIAGALIPGFGHALLRKWDRAIVFFACISLMFLTGIHLNGRLFAPKFGDIFSTMKFLADAGLGLLYWIPRHVKMGVGEPRAYTYDYANIFLYVAGLLNMLVIVDVFDIAMGRKK